MRRRRCRVVARLIAGSLRVERACGRVRERAVEHARTDLTRSCDQVEGDRLASAQEQRLSRLIDTIDALDQRAGFEHIGARVGDGKARKIIAWDEANTTDLKVRTRNRPSATRERFRIYGRGCGFFREFGFRCVYGDVRRSWLCRWFFSRLCRRFCRRFQSGCFHYLSLHILRSLGRRDRGLGRRHGRFGRWNRCIGRRYWSLCRRDGCRRDRRRRFRGGRAALDRSRFAWAGIFQIIESVSVTVRNRGRRFRCRRLRGRWFRSRLDGDFLDSRPKQVYAVAGQDDRADDQHNECDRGDDHHLPV